MSRYVVTVLGPAQDLEGCTCSWGEPCDVCLVAIDGLLGLPVFDSGAGQRTFTVEGMDSKDGRATVNDGRSWAYLDDVRPVVSRQEVDTPDELRESIRRIVRDGLGGEGDSRTVEGMVDIAVLTGEVTCLDGSTITVERKDGEA